MFTTRRSTNTDLISENATSRIYLNVDGKPNMLLSETPFQIIPTINKDREIIYIAGPSGVGKSTFMKKYAKIYHKIYPNRHIYLFSGKTQDESIDSSYITRLRVTTKMIEEPINVLNELKETLCLFDDVDNFDTAIQKYIYQVIGSIMELGRSARISIMVDSHLLNTTNKEHGRRIYNEADYIVMFSGIAFNQRKYFLEKYIGLSNQQIQKIAQTNSRWVAIHTKHPQYFLEEYRIYSLNMINTF